MLETHWTNYRDVFNVSPWSEINQDIKTNLFQAHIYSEKYTSMGLILNSKTDLSQIKRVISNMENIESASLQIFNSVDMESTKEILQIFAENKNMKELELHIKCEAPNTLQLLTLHPIQFTSIQLDIDLASIKGSFEVFFRTLEDYYWKFKGLKSLSLHFMGNGNNSNDLIVLFDSFSQKKIEVEEFQIKFSEIGSLSDKALIRIGEWVGFLASVRHLSLLFPGTSQMPVSGFEGFLKQLLLAQFQLESFILGMFVNPTLNAYKLLRKFFRSQEKLEKLELNEMEIGMKMVAEFLHSQLTVKKPKTIHYDLERNNIRSGGLVHLADFFKQNRSSLQTVKIFFDSSIYSGESMVEFGKAISSILFLKDLRLQFPGKITEAQVLGFAEEICYCSQLSYLYVNFSGFGSQNVIEFTSDSPEKTIFELESVKLSGIELQWRNYGRFLSSVHQFINVMIVSKNTKFKHLEMKFSSGSSYFTSKGKIIQRMNQILSSARGLITLKCNSTTISNQEAELIVSMIKENISTLTNFQLRSQITQNIFDALSPIGKDLLSIGVGSFVPGSLNDKKVLKTFPNLVEILYYQNNFNEVFQAGTGEELIRSDILLCGANQMRYTVNNVQKQIIKNSFEMKRVFVLHQIAFERSIQRLLTYKPKFMVLDLWID